MSGGSVVGAAGRSTVGHLHAAEVLRRSGFPLEFVVEHVRSAWEEAAGDKSLETRFIELMDVGGRRAATVERCRRVLSSDWANDSRRSVRRLVRDSRRILLGRRVSRTTAVLLTVLGGGLLAVCGAVAVLPPEAPVERVWSVEYASQSSPKTVRSVEQRVSLHDGRSPIDGKKGGFIARFSTCLVLDRSEAMAFKLSVGSEEGIVRVDDQERLRVHYDPKPWVWGRFPRAGGVFVPLGAGVHRIEVEYRADGRNTFVELGIGTRSKVPDWRPTVGSLRLPLAGRCEGSL